MPDNIKDPIRCLALAVCGGPCDHCGKPASEHECPEVISDRYDSQHPESEHDGGLGSGDWIGPWEDKR